MWTWLVTCTAFTLASAAVSLWEQACPQHCSCYVSGWPHLLLDAKTVNCERASLIHIPENISTEAEVLVLRHNILGHAYDMDLLDLLHLRRLMLLDLSFNRIRAFRNPGGIFVTIQHLNLSHNWLTTLEVGMFRWFPNLESLNLSSNRIISIAPLALDLPKLKLLDIRNNRMASIQSHYFSSLRSIRKLLLSNNHIGRMSDAILHHMDALEVLDVESNRMTKVDDDVFRFIGRIDELRLSKNHLYHVPHDALAAIPYVEKLILSRNYFRVFATHSFHRINVSILDIRDNPELFFIETRSFSDMPLLTELYLSGSRNLQFIEPNAFDNLPRLRRLDLKKNGLIVFQQDLINSLASLQSLSVSGNSFACDCSIRWMHDLMSDDGVRDDSEASSTSIKLEDGDALTCVYSDDGLSKDVVLVKNISTLPSTCPPRVLPLFPETVHHLPASNVSFLCAASGVPQPEVQWILPEREYPNNQTVSSRTVVRDNVLAITYLHHEDSGEYLCSAWNSLGNETRVLNLEVKDLNILITPLTVTSTFVTLSWNATTMIGTEWVLQYRPATSGRLLTKVISMGLKVHSYTLSGLSPGETYKIWLCLQRDNFIIRLSSVEVTMKDEGFFLMLGIHTNYLSLVLVAIGTGIVLFTCLFMCIVRIYKWRCRKHNEMVLSDNTSQRCFAKSESAHSDLAFMTFVNVADEAVLVENDDESCE